MKKLIRLSLMLATILLAAPSVFAQQYFYSKLSVTCTSSPVYNVDVYGDYVAHNTPSNNSGFVMHFSSPEKQLATPLVRPRNETYQLVELTVSIGGSAYAVFQGTELASSTKPLGTSGLTAYVYLINPSEYGFYIY